MKTCALYGILNAIASALLILALYFLGFHSDASKLTAAKWIGGLGGLAAGILITTLGVRARRAETPPDKEFGYGSAFLSGFGITVFMAILASLFFFVYNAYVNPGFADVIIQDTMDKMQAKGLNGAQLEQMEKGLMWFTKPAVQAIFQFFGVMFSGTVMALIIAIFVRRPAPATGQPKAV